MHQWAPNVRRLFYPSPRGCSNSRRNCYLSQLSLCHLEGCLQSKLGRWEGCLRTTWRVSILQPGTASFPSGQAHGWHLRGAHRLLQVRSHRVRLERAPPRSRSVCRTTTFTLTICHMYNFCFGSFVLILSHQSFTPNRANTPRSLAKQCCCFCSRKKKLPKKIRSCLTRFSTCSLLRRSPWMTCNFVHFELVSGTLFCGT